jgi:hypothetical protein
MAANRGSFIELLAAKLRLEVTVAEGLRKNGPFPIGSVAPGTTCRAVFVDLHSVLVDPILSSNMHAVWSFRPGRRLHFVAVIAVPHNASMLCVWIPVTGPAFQAAVSDGRAEGEPLIHSKGIVRRLSQLCVFLKRIIEAKLRLCMERCTYVTTSAIRRLDVLGIGAMAVGAGKILGERRREQIAKQNKDER